MLILLLLSCTRPVQQSKSSSTSREDPGPSPIERINPQIAVEMRENAPILISEEDYQAFQSVVFHENLDRSYDRLVLEEVNTFYTLNGNRTRWLGVRAPKNAYSDYMQMAEDLWKDGLEAEDYKFDQLQQEITNAYRTNDIQRLVILDFQVSFSFFLLSHHMAYGKINPRRLDSLWFVDERKMTSFTNDLTEFKSKKDLEKYFEKIRPPHRQYSRLMKKLEELTCKKASPVIDSMDFYLTKHFALGDKSEQIARIRKRLALEDLVEAEIRNPELFDAALHEAVIRFQERNGLDADGIVGPKTAKYLKKPLDEILNKIRVNMERIRWMPRAFGDDYIVVNIPDYSLQLFENNRKKMSMKVIVGRVMNKTPMFSDTLESIVFNPTWVIPQSIKVREMLPRLQEDSACFSDRDYIFYESWTSDKEVDPKKIDWSEIDSANFKYNIVQQPGPSNALGRVKFIMPNEQYIYLHDTPEDHLFVEKERNFSHGCIRVEQPMELARQLLRDKFLFPGLKVTEFSSGSEPHEVLIDKIYHVQITYRTAWVDDEGVLQQREDVYELDDLHLRYLE